jgi:16S rRNA (guanine(966)-N(2))-methyltransferase RsmD
MRIISGVHKGKRITAPKKLPVRPTTDMAKEALFNILNNQYHFEGLSVLDLFAGTGNISFEFASRGATDIYCIDSNAGCVKFIENVSRQLELGIKVRKMDVFKFLEQTNNTFDLIFADPPYDLSVDLFSKIHQLVFEKKLLNPNGTLILEHSKRMDLSALTYFTSKRKYGSSVFSFFEYTDVP